MNKEHNELAGVVAKGMFRCSNAKKDISEELDKLFAWSTSKQTASRHKFSKEMLAPIMLTEEEQELLIREQHRLKRQLANCIRIPQPTWHTLARQRCVQEFAKLTHKRRQAYAASVLLALFTEAMSGDTAASARLDELLRYAMVVEGRKTLPSATRIRELFGAYIKTDHDVERLRRSWKLFEVLGRQAKIFCSQNTSFTEADFVEDVSTAQTKLILTERQQGNDDKNKEDKENTNNLWSDIITLGAVHAVGMPVSRWSSEHEEAAQEVIVSLLERDIKYDKLTATKFAELFGYISKTAKSRYDDYRSAAMFKGSVSPRHSRRLRAQGIHNIEQRSISGDQAASQAGINRAEFMGFNKLFDRLSKRFKLSKKQLREQIEALCAAGEITQIFDGRAKLLSPQDMLTLCKRLGEVATPR